VMLGAVGWVVIAGDPFRSWATSRSARTHQLTWTAMAIGGVIAGGAGLFIISRTWYFATIMRSYDAMGSSFTVAVQLVERLLREQGRVWVNLPVALLPSVNVQKFFLVVYGLLGITAAAIALRGLWLRRYRLGPTDLYVVGIAAILFFNPFDMERHWLPAVPFLLCLAREAIAGLARPEHARLLFGGFAAWYIATGVAGMIWSTVISFSGSDFPRHYLQNRPTYRAAFGTGKFDPMAVRLDLLRLLRRYESLATDDYAPNPNNLPPPPLLVGPNTPVPLLK
jgi:hypothetical protein